MTKKRRLDSVARKKRRADIYGLQDGRCFWCKTKIAIEGATLDELVPRSKGGTQNLLNTVISCEPCNFKRADFKAPKWAFERVIERETKRGLPR